MRFIYSLLLIILFSMQSKSDVFSETKEIIKNLSSKEEDKFLGKYHFSIQNLIDIGLIKKENFKKSTYIDTTDFKPTIYWRNGLNVDTFLNNASNWTLKEGKKAFLDSELLQEETMDKLLHQNFEALLQKGLNMDNLSSSKALLVASHFGEVHNASRYALEDIDFDTQKSIKISSYFTIGAGNEALAKEAKKFLGNQYIWGGTNPHIGADCSGYVQYIYKKIGVKLPRTALQQSKYGKEISTKELQKGDLLFFNTDLKRHISVTHVGIYLENGKFIHSASRKKGIIISSLDKYNRVFVKAKRVIEPQKILKVPKIPKDSQEQKLHLAIDELLKKFQTSTLLDATMAHSKLDMRHDPLVIEDGVYIRQSQLEN